MLEANTNRNVEPIAPDADRPRSGRDWVSDPRRYALAWGLPKGLMILGIFAPASLRASIWTAALVWQGLACLANARRCGRTHCFFTGPFFLGLALACALHGAGVVDLGALGWWWIGLTFVLGTVGIWALSERRLGKFLATG